MTDYSRGKIYRIYSESSGMHYIGSTCEPTIAKRMVKHRSNYQGYKEGKYHYVSVFDVLEQDDYHYELIELYPCTCRDELKAREGHWIRKGKKDGDCVNIRIEGRTKKEYRKEYCEANKHKIKYNNKEYREANKDKIKYNKKEYREANKDTINEYNKEYREANKDRINEQITCECGSVVLKRGLTRHKKTIKHRKTVEEES